MTRGRPLVGVSADRDRGADRITLPDAYLVAITRAGGLPVVLSHDPSLVAEHVARLDAFVLPGGDDPETEAFGVPTDPRARRMDPQRQRFDLALLDALAGAPDVPVLGICLGMQLMALHAGGALDQFLPDVLPNAALHGGSSRHGLAQRVTPSALGAVPEDAQVLSSHRQAVRDAGRLRVIAHAPDGVIEAIDDPARPFWLGVQWHPERTTDDAVGDALFRALVAHARRSET